MRKFGEILQSLKPLIGWRGRKSRRHPEKISGEDRGGKSLRADEQASRLTLPKPVRRSPEDWQPLADSRLLRQNFCNFRDFMYRCNRKTKLGAGETPKALWESGKLAGDRLYFFLQPWNERGYLFEETGRGWVVSRAEKIALNDQFMRERSAWDIVILYHAADRPGLLRMMSEQMDAGIVSFALYEDFMSQVFEPARADSQ